MDHHADVIIVGGGIAGIVTALGLLDHNQSVLLLDRQGPAGLGGLARGPWAAFSWWIRRSNGRWE